MHRDSRRFSNQLLFLHVLDSTGMWEDQGEDEVEDDDDEDEGLAGQLLSDLIAANKYGTSVSQLSQLSLDLVLSFKFFHLDKFK